MFKVQLLGADRCWGWIGAEQRCAVLALLSLGCSQHRGDVQPQGMIHLELSKAQPACRSILFPDCCSPQIKPSVSSPGLGKDWSTSSCREQWPCLSCSKPALYSLSQGCQWLSLCPCLRTAHHRPLHAGMRCPGSAHDACHLMSPSSHRETKWTGKLAQDQCFPSKLAPTECRTPLLSVSAWHPQQPLPSQGQGQHPARGCCLSACAAGVGWAALGPGTAAWAGGTQPQCPRAGASSAPFGTGTTALPPAQTDGEPAQLQLLGLFGHYRELLRPTQIWLAGLHTPNANIWAAVL